MPDEYLYNNWLRSVQPSDTVIRAILFDFGGTLDADGLHWLDRFQAIYAGRPSLGTEPAGIKAAFYEADRQLEADPGIASCGLRETMRRHVACQLRELGIASAALTEELAAEFAAGAAAALARNRDVLQRLKAAGYRLGVLSNFYGNVATLCDEAGLAPVLDVVLDSAVVGLRKPDVAFFAAALDRLGTRAAETAMVGDSFDRDVRPARALGMHTFWVARQGVECPDLALVDGVIESLGELPARLAEAARA